MSNENIGTQNVSPTETAVQPVCADAPALPPFQQQFLAILAVEPLGGLAVKRALAELRDEPINHGRLYPNLDELVKQELVAKIRRAQRINEYALTDRRRRVLDAYVGWMAGFLNRGESA